MARFACPHCGSETIEKQAYVVLLRAREVVAWGEDGTPELAEDGFEEEVAGEVAEALVEERLDGEPYECGRCGRGFAGPGELKRLD